MDQRAFQLATRGLCINENKLACFEYKEFFYLLL